MTPPGRISHSCNDRTSYSVSSALSTSLERTTQADKVCVDDNLRTPDVSLELDRSGKVDERCYSRGNPSEHAKLTSKEFERCNSPLTTVSHDSNESRKDTRESLVLGLNEARRPPTSLSMGPSRENDHGSSTLETDMASLSSSLGKMTRKEEQGMTHPTTSSRDTRCISSSFETSNSSFSFGPTPTSLVETPKIFVPAPKLLRRPLLNNKYFPSSTPPSVVEWPDGIVTPVFDDWREHSFTTVCKDDPLDDNGFYSKHYPLCLYQVPRRKTRCGESTDPNELGVSGCYRPLSHTPNLSLTHLDNSASAQDGTMLGV